MWGLLEWGFVREIGILLGIGGGEDWVDKE